MKKLIFTFFFLFSFTPFLYANGDGVKQSYQEAVKWYMLSAEQGYPKAQYNLGILFADGKGVKQSYKMAKNWFKEACNNGFQEGCNVYNVINTKGY